MKKPPQPACYTYDATAEYICDPGTDTRRNVRSGEANDLTNRSPIIQTVTKKDLQDEANARGTPSTPAVKLARTGSEPSKATFYETSAQERCSVQAPSINSDVLRALREKAVTQKGRVPKSQAPASVAIPGKKRSKQNKKNEQKRSGPPPVYPPPNEETAPSRRKARKAFFTSRATSIPNVAPSRVINFVKESGTPTVSYDSFRF
uniref:Expressed protein n=2 Tax=Schizophyllum commune (strain H4-8 / FGSC 9210) TaxID=578458 RepID=D8PNM9_SCHCM